MSKHVGVMKEYKIVYIIVHLVRFINEKIN